MTTATTVLSRLTAIEASQIKPPTIAKAGRIVADGGTTLTASRAGRAIYEVQGDTGKYVVHLHRGVYVWSGMCSHYAERAVPQQRGSAVCSHILAAAYTEAKRLRFDTIPDPRTAPPRPEATVTSIALGSRTAEPRDPAEAARLARGRDPMEGFYD